MAEYHWFDSGTDELRAGDQATAGDPIPSGAGTPVGVLTPTGLGQLYRDTTNGALFISVGATDQDWVGYGQNDATNGFPDSRGYFAGPAYAGNLIACLPGEMVILSDTWSDGTGGDGSGIYFTAGHSDGQSRVSIRLNNNQWGFEPDGSVSLVPAGSGGLYVGLRAAIGVPDVAVGNNGDWVLSNNGHIYFKTGGAWAQKI